MIGKGNYFFPNYPQPPYLISHLSLTFYFIQGFKCRRISRNFAWKFLFGGSTAGDKHLCRFPILCRWKFGETTRRFHVKRPIDFAEVVIHKKNPLCSTIYHKKKKKTTSARQIQRRRRRTSPAAKQRGQLESDISSTPHIDLAL